MRNRVVLVIVIIVMAVILAAGIFAYRNLTYDYLNERFLEKSGFKAGFTENVAKLEDGSEIYYIEGPENGPSLLLLHGQQVNCYDYAKVLPKLSKHFHVFAPDYYGHGNSSKNPAKYNAVAIGNDLVWFIENVIKEKVYISGHSSGALLAAMDEKDALKVVDLVPESRYVGDFQSAHDIHDDLPDEYIQVLLDLKAQLAENDNKLNLK